MRRKGRVPAMVSLRRRWRLSRVIAAVSVIYTRRSHKRLAKESADRQAKEIEIRIGQLSLGPY
jgi:hypothetical protein